VTSATPRPRSIAHVTQRYAMRSPSIRRASGVNTTPRASAGRSLRAASSAARRRTVSSSFVRGTTSSTRFHSTARLPFTPSSSVQK
jgi:hypothetical protein